MNAEYLITMKEDSNGYGIKAYTQSVPEDIFKAVAAFLAGKAQIVPIEFPTDQTQSAEVADQAENTE